MMPDENLNEPFKLPLPRIDRLTEFINLKGPGCLVFKKDLKRAYGQIPVDPHNYHLLVSQWMVSFIFTLPCLLVYAQLLWPANE